jgi:hypothetical protein
MSSAIIGNGIIVSGRDVAPPPPIGDDVLIGNSLFISTLGNDATGEINNLNKHFATIDSAINHLSSDNDVIYIYNSTQITSVLNLPLGITTLNLYVYSNNKVTIDKGINNLINLNISGNGNIEIVDPQPNCIYAKINSNDFKGGNFLSFHGGEFYFNQIGLCTIPLNLTGTGLKIYITANKLEGNVHFVSPASGETIQINVNEWKGIFGQCSDEVGNDWLISAKFNKFYFSDDIDMFNITSNNSINLIPKVKLEGNIYYSNDNYNFFILNGGLFSFANCNIYIDCFEQIPFLLNKVNLTNNLQSCLFLKNCNITISQNEIDSVFYCRNNANHNTIIWIDDVNIALENSLSNSIIDSFMLMKYYGLSGMADFNKVSSWEGVNVNNMITSTTIQLINQLPIKL